MSKKDTPAWMNGFKNFNTNLQRKTFNKIRESYLELLFPKTCVICGKVSPYGICPKCSAQYPMIEGPRCMCCGKPIQQEEVELCNDCLEHKKAFEQGKSLWVHTGGIKNSIYCFKYKNKRIYAETYAQLLVQYYEEYILQWEIDGIIPVPIHRKRRKKRGYNQSEVLAQEIVKCLEKKIKIKIYSNVIHRTQQTNYQKKLNNVERRKNLKGAFQVVRNRDLPRNILLVDDIYTTGSTLNEIAIELKKHGVQKVFFFTISIGQGF